MKAKRLKAALTLLIVLVLAVACAAPSYYTQAISGHLALMNARQDIDDLLAAADTDPELARKLELAGEVRQFGTTELALPAGESYTQYAETGRDAVTWNVVAAPEFSLQPKQWCFLVSGCVTYRGYFARQEAQAYADKLAAEGYDVSVSPAVAYSTLGWFDDPLLDTMMRYSDRQLAAFLLHEMAHQKLYVKDDTAFNEAYANFVEEAGTRAWLRSTGRSAAQEEWERSSRAADRFQQLLLDTRAELALVYASHAGDEEKREQKSAAFADLERRYRLVVEQEWGGHSYYGSWFSPPPNNAKLALVQAYQGGVCAFESLFDEAGHDFARFHHLASGKAALEPPARQQWLQKDCPAIAPNHDL